MKKLFRFVYNQLPFKKQLYLLLKKTIRPPESVYRHLSFQGVFNVEIDKSSSFKLRHYGFQMENEIFWEGLTGGWEKVSMKLWIQLCRNSDVVFDIGANTGVYSLVAKAVNKNCNVFAFEPVQRVFNKLYENNALNHFDIKCFSEAVSDNIGTATIYDLPTDHIYSVTVNKDMNVSEMASIPVVIKTVTLDSIVENNNLQKIDLIKIDVETHEAEVLIGFSKYLRQFKPVLLIEILNDEVGRNVEQIVSGMNYLYFNIDERNGIRQVETITQSDFYNYLLCDSKHAKDGLI